MRAGAGARAGKGKIEQGQRLETGELDIGSVFYADVQCDRAVRA